MRAFVILVLATVAMARPEAPISSGNGYSYQQPSGSYGAPISAGSANLGGGLGHLVGGSLGGPSGNNFGGVNNLGSGNGLGGDFGASNFNGGLSHAGLSNGGLSHGGLSNGFGGGSLIQKHIYVHVPPPEVPEERPIRPILPQTQPQKHYKIIFIKAPTPPTPVAPVIPALTQQDEQKTLIYVLVKKPDEAPEIQLPSVAPTQPSKPEVYFIKYKTQKEVSGNGLGGGHNLSGPGLGNGGLTEAGAGSSVIGTSGPSAPSGNYGPPGGSGPY